MTEWEESKEHYLLKITSNRCVFREGAFEVGLQILQVQPFLNRIPV